MDAKNKIWELWQAIKQVKNESIQGMDNLFSKVTDNATAIANETTRAKAAEKVNADAITALNNRIKIISITNSDYTALATKDANILYCIPE